VFELRLLSTRQDAFPRLLNESFRLSIALQISGVALLSIIIASALLFFRVHAVVKQDRESILGSATRQLTIEYEDDLARWVDQFDKLATLEEQIRSQNLGEGWQSTYYKLYAPITDFDEILVVNRNNGHTTALIKKEQDIDPNSATLQWLKDLPTGNSISGLSCETSKSTNTEPHKHMVFAAPLKQNSTNSSTDKNQSEFLVALLDCTQLSTPISQTQKFLALAGFEKGDPYVVAENGDTILSDLEKWKVGKSIRNNFGTMAGFDAEMLIRNLKEAPEITQHNNEEKARIDDKPRILTYNFEGKKTTAVATVSPPVLAGLSRTANIGPEFKWHVAVGIMESEEYKLANKLRLWFIVLPTATALLILFFVYIYATRYLQLSLSAVTQLVKDAAKGNIATLVSTDRKDEVGELAQALNELLIAVKTREPFHRLQNPYVVGNPIRNDSMFFGRKDDLRWVGEQLESGQNKFISLVGQRRIGKTSLLHRVHAGGTSSDVLTLFFDTQEILPQISCDSDFYKVLTRDISRQLKTRHDVKAEIITSDQPTANMVTKLLRYAAGLKAMGVVVLIDEIDNFDDKFGSGQLNSQNILWFLAGLLESDAAISFVTTASERAAFNPERWEVLMPKMISRRIGLLSINDAICLIEDPVRGKVLYGPSTVNDILRLTAGHPYYTQLVCQNIVDRLNEIESTIATSSVLLQVIDFIVANPPLPLGHLWETLTTRSKIAITCLAECIQDSSSAKPVMDVASVARQAFAGTISDADVPASLLELRNEDWLEEVGTGSYRFRIDLVRHWLRRHHSIYSVAAEKSTVKATD
jgi:HAMP domain-containing protein